MIRKGCKIQATCFSKFMLVRLNGSCDFLMHSSNDKKIEGEDCQVSFFWLEYLLWDGADPGMCSPYLTGTGDLGWPWLAPQDLPPHSEPFVPLGMTFPAFSTHPPAVSRRGAAQALLPVSRWVEPLSCLYWTWREERPVVSSATLKRRKLLSSVSKFATSLGFCRNREGILGAFSKGIISLVLFPFSFHCCIFFFLCIVDQWGPSVMSTGLILPDTPFLLTSVAAEESLNLGWE